MRTDEKFSSHLHQRYLSVGGRYSGTKNRRNLIRVEPPSWRNQNERKTAETRIYDRKITKRKLNSPMRKQQLGLEY